MATIERAVRPGLQELLAGTKAGCTNCGLCVGACAFLKKHGTPGQIAGACDAGNPESLRCSFQCSLCGLCSQLCPEQLDLDGMFLEMRREAVDRGFGGFRVHAPLLAYERVGTSRRFSLYRLPEGCSTVFFPGCSLSGTRPDAVKRTFAELRKLDLAAGIVFDCCLKPSHSLGREQYVSAMFDEMTGWLLRHGVEEVLVACPNCQVMFEALGRGLRVMTVWERLADSGIPLAPASGTVTVHDPCVLRQSHKVHQAVRDLLQRQGVTVEEMPHSGASTVCCGKGGAVDMLDPGLASSWGELREQEAEGRRTITYCAGCVQALGGHTPTSHLVDMLFSPEETMAGKKRGASGVLTYANRLLLKKSFKRKEGFAVSRERNHTVGEGERRKSFWQPLILLALLTAAVVGVQLSGASEYLQQDRLRALIASYGTLLDLLSGRVSPAALAGMALILVVVLAPVCYRRRKARRGGFAATE